MSLTFTTPGPDGDVEAPGGVLETVVSGKVHRALVTVTNTGDARATVAFTIAASSAQQEDAIETYSLEPPALSLGPGASGELFATVRIREGNVMGDRLTFTITATPA